MNRSGGYSLVELLTALTLAGLLGCAAAALLQAQAALSRSAAHQTEAADALRTSAHVLTMETRWSDGVKDVRASAPDSLALRAFRASAVILRIEPDGRLFTRLQALRAPDPTKDSVLVLMEFGREETAQLTEATASHLPCGQGACYLLRISQPVQPGSVLLIFESGTYYLTTRALRYRLGAEGRQPITAELLDDRLTFFDLSLSKGAWLSIRARTGGYHQLRVRLPFLNQTE
ncbi:MAG: hypothetical protein WEE89_10335 [Gemmatimonadota bacterium]